MKHVALWFTALALAFGVTTANADAEKGFYVGAGLGQFSVEVDDLDDAQDTVSGFDEEDTSWKIFAGWRFNPYFAVELDYIDFGGPSSNNTEVAVDGFAPYLIGTIPLGIFEIFAQVGYYFYDFDVESSNNLIPDFSDSGEDLVYGGGVGFILFERLNARIMYEIFDSSDADDSNALWLSGSWRF